MHTNRNPQRTTDFPSRCIHHAFTVATRRTGRQPADILTRPPIAAPRRRVFPSSPARPAHVKRALCRILPPALCTPRRALTQAHPRVHRGAQTPRFPQLTRPPSAIVFTPPLTNCFAIVVHLHPPTHRLLRNRCSFAPAHLLRNRFPDRRAVPISPARPAHAKSRTFCGFCAYSLRVY
jgi:hypothetical protein